MTPPAHPPEEATGRGSVWLRPLPLAVAGALAAGVDALLLRSMGLTIELGGHDATWINAAFVALNYGALGYLLGFALEARRRDRTAAGLIREQTEEVAAARARLAEREKLAALGELSAAIAHEVRNPLGVIRSAAQSVAETLPRENGEARRDCAFIIAEIDRLTSVVKSLLSFVRPLELRLEAVEVPALLDRVVLLAGEETQPKRLRIARREPATLPPLRADPDLACQVLLDLLSNAVDASPAGTEIIVDARSADGAVEIGVEDAGPGVPAELRGRIFEPFFTTRPRGVGLGLAVARQIVEAHGGSIVVGERSGGGARFAVRWPAARPERAVA